jgi:predicted nucleotidyltransferase component of viral defense system
MEHKIKLKMKLHENTTLFKEAISVTSGYKGLPESYVEKDYWVTLALDAIFKSEIGSQAVFKGGTALSKCFNAIERFSEDIDIVVLRNGGETDSQLASKIKKISRSIQTLLPEKELEGITRKRGKIRKTAHPYQRLFDGHLGQVRDCIVLEATWLGHFEPYITAFVQSFVAEMLIETGQSQAVEEYGLQPFEVRVLTQERTFCEKIMSLVRFSFTEYPIIDLNNKVRHIYDIHKLLENEVINTFFESPNFDEMLLRVANEDVKSFNNNNAWLANHPTKAIIFADPVNTWEALIEIYNTDFGNLVFGELPSEKDILDTLNKVSTRLKPINWTIMVNVEVETQQIQLENINEKEGLKITTIIENLHSMNTRELSELIDELQNKLG